MLDISVSGAFLVTDRELPVGNVYAFRLGEAGQGIDLRGRVVRVVPPGESGPWQVAITFEDLTRVTQRDIATTISRLLVATPRPAS